MYTVILQHLPYSMIGQDVNGRGWACRQSKPQMLRDDYAVCCSVQLSRITSAVLVLQGLACPRFRCIFLKLVVWLCPTLTNYMIIIFFFKAFLCGKCVCVLWWIRISQQDHVINIIKWNLMEGKNRLLYKESEENILKKFTEIHWRPWLSGRPLFWFAANSNNLFDVHNTAAALPTVSKKNLKSYL